MDDGRTLTYRELEERSNQLAHLFRAAGLDAGDHIAFVAREPARAVRGGVGAPSAPASTTRPLHPAERRRARVHRRRLRRPRARRRRRRRSTPLDAVDAPDVELRLLLDGTRDGWERYDDVAAAHPATPIDDQAEGADMLYSSGTTGRPKGVKVPLPSGALPGACPPSAASAIGALRRHRGHGLPVAGAAVPRRAAAVLHGRPHRIGATVVVMEHFDPEAFLRLIEQHRVTFTQVVPDDVHPPAQAARRRAGQLRRVVAAGRRPRRRPVPGRGEGADDRVVGPGDPRVLRRHRGQRLRLLQQRAVARPQGHGRARRCIGTIHILDEDGEEVPVGETGTVYFEGGADFEYHGDPEKTKGSTRPEGPGLVDPRRRRLPRRRRVPLPDRPQGVHDHQRRREHLSAGGRERPGDAPQGRRRRRLRHPRRRDGRGGPRRRAAGRGRRAARPRSPPS